MGKVYTLKDREKAFRIFVDERTFVDTAKRTGVSEKTLYKWAKEDGWDRRVTEISAELQKVIEREGLEELIADDIARLKVLRVFSSMVVRGLSREGGLTPRSLAEAINAMDYVWERQDKILGKKLTQPELPISITEETLERVRKIIFGGEESNADKERRRKAAEFRNRQTPITDE